MHFLRLFTRKILFLINLVAALVFLLACLVPYIGPDKFWPISFLGLGFPYLALLITFFLIFWLFFKPKNSLLSLICLLIGWKSLSVVFAFHPGVDKPSADSSSAIKVMSYNVRYFKDFDLKPARNETIRAGTFELIKKQHPDILCMQEFYTSENPSEHDNKAIISREMNLPYRYFSSDHNYKNNHSGVILFSKYPVIHSGKLKLLQNSPYESAIFADILRGQDTIRIYTVHLQSIYLNHKDLEGIQHIKAQEDTGLVASRIILGKLRKAFLKREFQARTLSDQIKSSPYPVILCGDFNDTPNSYAYFKIKGSLQDAFLKKGLGIGRTYTGIAPTLRIDYIFTSKNFHIYSFRRIRKTLSDHYAIVSEVALEADRALKE